MTAGYDDDEYHIEPPSKQKLPESQTMTKPTAQKAVAGKSNGKKTGKQSADKSTAGAQTATKPAVDKPDSAKPETSKPRPSKPAERDPNYRPTSGDPHVDMLVEHEEEKLLMYNTMKYYRSKTRINHLRHLMDYMMYCEDGLDTPARNDQFAPSVPKYIKDDFNNLLMKRRKHLEPQSVVNAWEWKSVPEEEVLEITNPEMMERSVIYPLHSPQELHPISADTIMHLQRETDKLKQLVQRRLATLPSSNELVCKLCSTAPMPAHAMRIHLYSNAHRERESEFRTF